MERPMDLLERIYLPEKKWQIIGFRKDGTCQYGEIRFDTEKAAQGHLDKYKDDFRMQYYKTFLILPV